MDKQEYKAMKTAWSESVNDKDNHSYKDETYGNKVKGKLFSVHYLVYNILRMMPAERGFEPVGEGFKEAQWWLKYWLQYEKYHKELLFPFKGTVTIEQLRELL